MNDSLLAARHRDPAADASDPADSAVPDGRLQSQDHRDARDQLLARHPNERETVSQETILGLLGESAAMLRGTGTNGRDSGPDAVPVLTEQRLFAEMLIDTADDLLETLQRERAENWAFRFADPARAAVADILQQLRSRTESLERISAACHGLLWHIRRAQDLGVVVLEPSGALTPAGWFVELIEALAGTARHSGSGIVLRHPAWALTEVLQRFRGAPEVRQYLDRVCAQSHGAVERLLAEHVLPLVQSLRTAQASYSLLRA